MSREVSCWVACVSGLFPSMTASPASGRPRNSVSSWGSWPVQAVECLRRPLFPFLRCRLNFFLSSRDRPHLQRKTTPLKIAALSTFPIVIGIRRCFVSLAFFFVGLLAGNRTQASLGSPPIDSFLRAVSDQMHVEPPKWFAHPAACPAGLLQRAFRPTRAPGAAANGQWRPQRYYL